MSAKWKVIAPFFVVALAAQGVFAAQGGNDNGKHRLLGTWKVSLTASQPEGFPPVDVLMTFMPGQTKNEGTFIDTNSLQFFPNPICTDDQGVWEKTGNSTFVATAYNFCFDQTSDPAGNPAGTSKIRTAVTLDHSGDSISIHQYVEGFDPGGTLVFTAVLDGEGTRVTAEAPPAP